MDENEYRWKRPDPDREPPKDPNPGKKPKRPTLKIIAWIPFVIVAAIVISIFFNSFYELKEDEYAVITTLGKPSVVSTSGLKFKWPFIQHKTIVSKATKGFPIGYDLRTGNSIPSESVMITVDKVDDVITTGKSEIQAAIKDKILTRLEQEDLGITLVNISIQDAEPPTVQVQEAFKAVETAKQDAETATNNANKYANEVLPAAQADADEVLQQAEAYKTARINEANGQASRFAKLFEEYSKYPEITKQRLFFEAVSDIFPDMKIVITGKGGNEVTTVLPLDDFIQTGKEEE